MTEGHEDYLGDLWDLLPTDPTDFLEDTPTENESEKAPTSEWAFDHDADVSAHHTKFTNTEHDLVARHPLAVLDPLVCSEAEAAILIADHKALPNDHHTKFTNTEHDVVARHPLANLDALVCSEAEAGVLIGNHAGLPGIHHSKYTDAEARVTQSPMTVVPCGFMPTSYLFDFFMGGDYLYNGSVLTAQYFQTQVNFPNGVTITKFTVYGHRVDADAIMRVRLKRTNLSGTRSDLAEVLASWVDGDNSAFDDTITTAVIDNTSYGYFVEVLLDPNAVITDVKFSGAKIEFTG